MDENIEITQFYYNDSDIEEIGELYCRTFLKWEFSLEDKRNAINNINKHALNKGFKGLKAKDSKGNIIGFTYGYTSLPDQFYREKVSAHLSAVEISTWLNNCFEFVELAISPAYKRLGIASKLHDILLKKLNHKTSLLTTGVENNPAINLYRKKGWKLIKSDAPVISTDNLQVIMGKEIN